MKETRRVLAIMQKEIQDRNYTQISYLANDVYAHKLFREFCLQNPDAPVSQSTINYSTLLPRQQAKEQMFFALEQKEEQRIKMLAMPKIGAGLDKMPWKVVLSIIIEVFNDEDITILICDNSHERELREKAHDFAEESAEKTEPCKRSFDR